MTKLLIVADDFTGALDTGVQFTKQGIRTLVTTNENIDIANMDPEVSVLVVDVESRHISPEMAYERVKKIVSKAKMCGITHIYKKTDSALRGNIGSELQAVMDACGENEMFFIPAFPKIGRTTKLGYHYLDGVPIHESVFGQDPFEPVRHSFIPDVIGEQSAMQVVLCETGDAGKIKPQADEKTLYVFDAESSSDLEENGKLLKQNGKIKLLAGCAGFAEMLAGLLEIEMKPMEVEIDDLGMIVVSGSVNQITLDQLNYAKENGFFSHTFEPVQKLDNGFVDSKDGEALFARIDEVYKKQHKVVLEAVSGREDMKVSDDYAEANGYNLETIRTTIADNIGKFVAKLVKNNEKTTLVVFGGDTLIAIMQHVGCEGIVPLTEITPGVVMAQAIGKEHQFHIVTKSGGFGEKDVIKKIEKYLDV